MTTVGERIRTIRKKKGMTQSELGSKCGLSDSAIRRYELGGANPKIETIEKIAAGLDVDIQELYQKKIVIKVRKSDTQTKDKETIIIDTRGVENHPYEKFRRGEKLTPEEEEELQLYFDETIKALPNIFKEFGNKLKEHYQLLNEKGQQRAKEQLDRTLEQIEMLTKIPEYQRKEEN